MIKEAAKVAETRPQAVARFSLSVMSATCNHVCYKPKTVATLAVSYLIVMYKRSQPHLTFYWHKQQDLNTHISKNHTECDGEDAAESEKGEIPA